jgi:thiamine-phosphate pyrophosphorylase
VLSTDVGIFEMNGASGKVPSGLYAICDDSIRPELSLTRKSELLLEGGVRVIQLRMKSTPVRDALAAARVVSALCRAAGAVCLVDDRVDLALIANAHGVHLGDDDLPARRARELLGPDRIIGVTVRNAQMAEEAKDAGADYVGLGPVFPTATKSVAAPVLGIESLAKLVHQSPLPTVAISGIRLSNIGSIARAGAHGAAVISDLLTAPDIPARARELSKAFAAGRGS